MANKPRKLRNSPFQVLASNPGFWVFSAETLHRAASILWKQQERAWRVGSRPDLLQRSQRAREQSRYYDAYMPALLLMGLAVENLLKAIAVRRGNP
jgi:hypothetical protein